MSDTHKRPFVSVEENVKKRRGFTDSALAWGGSAARKRFSSHRFVGGRLPEKWTDYCPYYSYFPLQKLPLKGVIPCKTFLDPSFDEKQSREVSTSEPLPLSYCQSWTPSHALRMYTTNEVDSNFNAEHASEQVTEQAAGQSVDQRVRKTAILTSNQTSAQTSDQTAGPTAKISSDQAGNKTVGKTSNQTSAQTSDQTSHETSDETSDQTSNQASDQTAGPTGGGQRICVWPSDHDDSPNIGAVVNLCLTERYYNPADIPDHNVDYYWFCVDGAGRIPSHAQIFAFLELFFMLGTKFPGQFIVLHCTHGVNRTGFFSALLLMIFGELSCEDAVKTFARVRKHPISREELLIALHDFEKTFILSGVIFKFLDVLMCPLIQRAISVAKDVERFLPKSDLSSFPKLTVYGISSPLETFAQYLDMLLYHHTQQRFSPLGICHLQNKLTTKAKKRQPHVAVLYFTSSTLRDAFFERWPVIARDLQLPTFVHLAHDEALALSSETEDVSVSDEDS